VTFDAFADAVDDRVRTLVAGDYGIYRGPHVAFWHAGDTSARLRAGIRNDVELEVPALSARHVFAACTDETADRVAELVAHALGGRAFGPANEGKNHGE